MAFGISGAVIAGALVAGSTIYSANQARSAANAQAGAANNASQTQWDMYNQSRQDQTPWRTAGGQAVNALSNWYGLGGVAGTGAGTGNQATSGVGQPIRGGGGVGGMNGVYGSGPVGASIPGGSSGGPSAMTQQQTIENTPGYQFNFQQGEQAVQRNLASQGLLNSGAAGKELTQYGQGFADNYQQQYVSGLQSLAGLGQTSTQATGALGAGAANQIGSNAIYAGNANAYGQIGQANAVNQGIGSLISLYGRNNNSSYWSGG